MKAWQWAAMGLGTTLCTAGYLSWLKKLKKQTDEWERQHQEIDKFIKDENEYLANLANCKTECIVTLEDGTKMEFGEYLDKFYLDTVMEPLLKTEEDLRNYLES